MNEERPSEDSAALPGQAEPQPNAPEEPAGSQAASCDQTGYKGLAAIARHTGLDWSLPRLLHVYGQDREPDAEQLARAARAEGLNAAVHRIDWRRLQRFRKLTPFLARLTNDAYVVILQTCVTTPATADAPAEEQVVLFNPRSPEANLFPVPRDEFLSHWTGEIVLLKRVYKMLFSIIR